MNRRTMAEWRSWTAMFIACVLALGAFGGPVDAQEPDPEKIVKDVRHVLDTLKTCSFRFKTVQSWTGSDFTRVLEGTVYMRIEDPFLLRVEREDNLIVIDGETVYTWLPEHNQVQVTGYDDSGPEFPSPRTVFERYADTRKAAWRMEDELEGRLCDVLSLLTDDPTDVLITVWVDRETHFPVKAVEETVQGNRVVHTLADVALNPDFDEALFTFVPPDDAAVVDMRE